MKVKDLFNVILKVFGLLVFLNLLNQAHTLVTAIIYFIDSSTGNGFALFILAALYAGVHFFVGYTLLFNTGTILKRLKFSEEFSETDLNVDLSRKNMLTVALVFTASFVLIDEIPNFFRYLYNYYELKEIGRLTDVRLPAGNLIFSLVKIIIASVLIGERKRILFFLLKEAQKKEAPVSDPSDEG